jgi:Raf kinase inhibitor-like YbhB/YbcL family protein
MRLTSPAFSDGSAIPPKYTEDGDDVSPPLAWRDLPPQTQSLALIVDDPDAPDPAAPLRTWVHWVVVDLPPEASGLPEGVSRLPAGKLGVNDWNRAAWDGPAPPVGKHRYVFKLYALDQKLGLERPSKAELERAMQGHILEQAKLTGTYQRGTTA